MRSFKRQPDNRRAIYLQLAGSIEGQLRQAYAECHDEHGVTQASLADKLGVDRSVVHRRLTGRANMTIETIADMVWALGNCINVNIFDPTKSETNGFQIIPESVNFEPTKRVFISSIGPNLAGTASNWQVVQ